jgi:hypothetical protein
LHQAAILTGVRYENDRPTRCAACGKRLPRQGGRGRPRRFCGDACRVAAYRRREQELPESFPRWSGPRGQIALEDFAGWDRERRAEAVKQERLRRRRLRDRAERRWQKASAAAEGHGVSTRATKPSQAAAEACRELAAAAAACAEVGIPGQDWVQLQAQAVRRAEQLTPRGPSRAERRRRQREEAKAEAARRRVELQAAQVFRRALRDR